MQSFKTQKFITNTDVTDITVQCTRFIFYTGRVTTDRQSRSSLSRVHLFTYSSVSVSLDWLFQQSCLTYLCLRGFDLQPLTQCTEVTEPLFPLLQDLTLVPRVTLSRQTVQSVCSLLLSPTSLRECNLVLRIEDQCVTLIQQALARCVSLHDLDISLELADESPCTVGLVCHILPHLSSLQVLRLDYDDVKDSLPDLIDTLSAHRAVTCYMWGKSDMSPETQKELQQIGVQQR